jgi:ankyrin repeat protein
VGSLNFHNADLDLQSLIRSVTYLIKGAIFRPGYAMSESGRSSLDICPLGELIDMYHIHEATELHDKVFALLGMSSDDLSKASLSPNYGIPWEELFQNLIKFLLYDKISTETLGHKQIALINSKGCILGKVSRVQSDIAQGGSQGADIIFNNISRQLGYKEGWSAHWTLHNSANSVREGDLVCLLQGASKPTIVRLHDDHFDIIMIAATPLEEMLKLSQSMKTLSRNFLLIWDWEKQPKEVQGLEQHETLLQTKHWASDHSKIGFEDLLGKATRTWKVVMILEDSAEYEKAQEKIQEAIKGYEIAAVGGHQGMVKHLLETGEVDVDFKHKDGTTPLWWAAKEGHDTMIKLLLNTGEVNIDSKHEDGTTPLWWAAKGGHLAAVERLLQEKAEVNIVGGYGGITALQAAAGGGHLAVVKRLLQEKAEVNTTAGYSGMTALQAAAGGGHLAVVEQMLQEKAEVNTAAAESSGRTALQAAAGGGHLAVVERLLQEKAEVNAAAAENSGRTALQAAAEGGHLAVVERLLQEKAEVNTVAAKYGGRTALQAAAEGGHLAIIERLFQEKAKVNAAAAESSGRTALQAAAGGGHLAVVERLLQEKAKVNAAAAEYSGRTALQAAAEGGHLAVVERLLQEKAEVNPAAAKYIMMTASQQNHKLVVDLLLKYEANTAIVDKDGYTCLHFAVFAENDAMVQEFIDQGFVNKKDHYGATPLHYASKKGHEAIVQLLLEGGADVNAVCNNIDTAIILASWRNHKPVVDLLLKYGANAAMANKEGYTCLHFAVEARSKAMVQVLLDWGASIEANDSGETPLAASIRRGYDEITCLLEEKSEQEKREKEKREREKKERERERENKTSNGVSSRKCSIM